MQFFYVLLPLTSNIASGIYFTMYSTSKTSVKQKQGMPSDVEMRS